MNNLEDTYVLIGDVYGFKYTKKFLKKEKNILLFNSNGEYELTEKQYELVNVFKKKISYEEKILELKKSKLFKREDEINKEIEFLLEQKILIKVDLESDSIFMNEIFVKRNGLGLGKIDNKWSVLSNHLDGDSQKIINLESNEEYRIWICATSSISMGSLLEKVCYRMNNQEEDAAKYLFKKHMDKFIDLGIWQLDVKYKNNINNGNSSTSLINEVFLKENLREDSLIVPIGYENGVLSNTKKQYWISRGKEWQSLPEEEYKLWLALNKKIMKMGQLQFEYMKSTEELSEELIIPMLEKKMILIWDTDKLMKSSVARVESQGKCIISDNDEYSCKFNSISNLGYSPTTSKFMHKLWMSLSAQKTIEDIIIEMKEWSCEDIDSVKEKVVENIRALISLGLAKIDIFE